MDSVRVWAWEGLGLSKKKRKEKHQHQPSKSNASAQTLGQCKRYFLSRLLIVSIYFLRWDYLVLISSLGKLPGQMTASASGRTLSGRREDYTSQTPLTSADLSLHFSLPWVNYKVMFVILTLRYLWHPLIAHCFKHLLGNERQANIRLYSFYITNVHRAQETLAEL